MNPYLERLEVLRQETNRYFHSQFDSIEAEKQENLRIKSEVLKLISDAKESGSASIYSEVKALVIKYLSEVCGCADDLEILRQHTPSILSEDEVKFVIQNSALSRWF